MNLGFQVDELPGQTPGYDEATTVDDLAELTKRWKTVTPGKLSKILGVGHNRVLDWIKAGELIARDMSSVGSRTPRFAIPIQEVERFLQRRSTVTRAGSSRVRRF